MKKKRATLNRRKVIDLRAKKAEFFSTELMLRKHPFRHVWLEEFWKFLKSSDAVPQAGFEMSSVNIEMDRKFNFKNLNG